MRYFRRLPLFLRVASIVGLLFSLASIALFAALLVSFITSRASSPQPPVDSSRAFVIALNLSLLSGACSSVINTYTTRFRQPGGRPLPLDSWQSQARAVALLAGLPLCAIMLAVVIPPSMTALAFAFFALASVVSIFAAVVLLVANLRMVI